MKVTALAAHAPEAVRAALAARGWEAQPAWFAAVGIQPRPVAHGADLLDRPLRSHVVRTDQKHDRIDEAEGVPEHQLFHLSVVAPAPV